MFTSSPFSDLLSLENNMNFMNQEPTSRIQNIPSSETRGIPINRAGDKSGAIMILSLVLAILVVLMSIGFCVVKQ